MVVGEPARAYLERVNHDMALMKLALHRIARVEPTGIASSQDASRIAREALEECGRG